MNNSLIILKSYLLTFFIGALFIGGAFVFSDYVLADEATTQVEVGNATPSVTAVNISPDPINLTENATTVITITATISDSNGCDDVFASGTITAVLYRSGVGGGASCTADDSNCYPNITLAEVDDTCTGGTDTSGDASETIAIWYFAEATDASSSFSGQTWQATVKAVDGSNASSTNTDSSSPVLNTQAALNVTASINYGTLSAGTTSTLTQIQQSTTTVTNTGNSSLDSDISGTNMTSGGNTIDANYQKFATSSAGYDSLIYTLSTSAQTIQFNLAKATSSSTPATANSFWGINVPNGQANGIYNGTSTFDAVWSSD